MVCPICGNEKLTERDYYDDGYHVENYTACEECNNFVDHWAYGRQEIVIQDKHWDFTCHPYIEGKDIEISNKAWLEIQLELVGCKYYDGSYNE